MAAPRIRKLITAQGAFDSVLLQGHDGHPIPWDVVVKKLAELFRFLASAFLPLVAGIEEWAAAMLDLRMHVDYACQRQHDAKLNTYTSK